MIKRVGRTRVHVYPSRTFRTVRPLLEQWHRRLKSDLLNCFTFLLAPYAHVGYCSADLTLERGEWRLNLSVPCATPAYEVIVVGVLVDERSGEQLHATVIVADKRRRTVAWFDPHGASQFAHRVHRARLLRALSTLFEHTFTRYLAPHMRNSLQVTSGRAHNYRDVAGYCLYWSFALVDFYLLNGERDLRAPGRRLRAAIDSLYEGRGDSNERRMWYIRGYMMHAWRVMERFAALLRTLRYAGVNDTAFLRGLFARDARYLAFGRNRYYLRRFADVRRAPGGAVRVTPHGGGAAYEFVTRRLAAARVAFFLIHVVRARRIGDYRCELARAPWRAHLADVRDSVAVARKRRRRAPRRG